MLFRGHLNYTTSLSGQITLIYGKVGDWRAIQNYYGMNKIKKEVLQSRHLDMKTLSFLSCIFDIPKERFRCHTMKQYNPNTLRLLTKLMAFPELSGFNLAGGTSLVFRWFAFVTGLPKRESINTAFATHKK